MVTIICGTNRPKNQTLKVVSNYKSLLEEAGESVQVLCMEELPSEFLISDTYGERTDEVQAIIDGKIVGTDRFVFISPEYNGSYPGVLKVFLDGVEPGVWTGKKAALVGVSSGRAGNLRGMDHLTDVLHHLKVEVYSQKIPISKLHELMDQSDELVDQTTVQILRSQIEGFLKF